jgi:beta-mannosidase
MLGARDVAAAGAIPVTPDVLDLTAWLVAETAPREYASPADLDRSARSWFPAEAPGTVASALRAAGQWDFDRPRDFDAREWWYRCAFKRPAPASSYRLRFDGLATLADVWLNGTHILTTSNMFQPHAVDVTSLVGDDNEVVICFGSLSRALEARRPRPKWKTKLVASQQLRWVRTTLLGRMPGWSPPVAPVGPWRRVVLESRRPGTVTDIDLRASLDGTTGVVDFSCVMPHDDGRRIAAEVIVGDVSVPLTASTQVQGVRWSGQVRVLTPSLWWPHTHGRPHLYPSRLRVDVAGDVHDVDCGLVGFRAITARQDAGEFAIDVNGVPIFCRGACWTVGDVVSCASPDPDRELSLAVDAGANMIRIGGTMTYESDEFYRRADARGVLVWQDFMFANMDYPSEDAAFVASVEAEVTAQLRRLCRHPCVAVYCGNSEVEQQAAMLGVDRSLWRNTLFAETLPRLCRTWHPDVSYVPSSPSGGALPFHASDGVSHYYGVGAYLRPLEDARRARVRFASECLGFANIPDDDVVADVMGGGVVAVHDPRWKARVPRDTGAGWDFEDVRDHYLGALFATDPVVLRSHDPSRYLELGRVTTGEMMARVFAEWRSAHSVCRGGLVWFLKDLWPGGGWGMLDSRGRPKACFHYLRRAWQPRAVLITDEGLNGIDVHVVNDRDEPLSGTLDVTWIRAGRALAAHATPCDVDARATRTFGIDALAGRFSDVSYAYRFGPPAHDVIAASLIDANGRPISETWWIRDAADVAREDAGSVTTEAVALDDGAVAVTLTSEKFLCAAHIDMPGYLADDDYFSLLPGRTKIVRCAPTAGAAQPFTAEVRALNLRHPVGVSMNRRRGLVAS